MIRDKSKSKLSSASFKAQIKETIKVAMGKSIQKVNTYNQPRRSSSVKSLRSGYEGFNQIRSSSSQLKMQKNIQTFYQKQDRHRSEFQSPYKKKVSQQEKAIIIDSFQWWHKKDSPIQTQTKVIQSATGLMHYFAQTNNPRNIKLDDTLHLGNSSFQIYLINRNKNQLQRICSNFQDLKIDSPQITHILIVDSNNQYNDKSSDKASSLGAIVWNSNLDKFIMNKLINKSTKLIEGIQSLINHQYQPIFYLCLHVHIEQVPKKKLEKSQKTKQVKKSQIKVGIIDENDGKNKKKSIILQNLIISKEALKRYKN